MGLTKPPTNEGNKVGDLFPSSSLEDYAAKGRDHNHCVDSDNNLGDGKEDDLDEEGEGEENESENGENDEDDLDEEDNPEHQNENGDKVCN